MCTSVCNIAFKIFVAEELKNLLADNGLRKILNDVRSQLQQSKKTFMEDVENRFDSFYSLDEIDNRIITKLWKELEEMKCDYLCPWCGMPCGGMQNCNDLYVQGEVPSTVHAKVKHTCQFHRDGAITGVGETSNGELTNRLPNTGDCPRMVKNNAGWIISDPENRDGPEIWVPTTYYDTTWLIKPYEEDPDHSSGYFWQWFLAFVSY